MTMKYDKFLEAWNDLDRSDKIACFNDYAREYNADVKIYEFDEDFFDANLVSMNEYEAAEWADNYVQDIYEHEEIWSQYIDEKEEEDDD